MNDDNHNPEDMPEKHGDNIVVSEKKLGEEAARLGKRYDSLINRIGKDTHEVHDVIIAFGRKLQEGLDMYGPGYEFGQWIKRRHLDSYGLCSTQQERTACMIIMRLHDVGVEAADDEGDGTTTPARLDLTECKRTRPTDILKWARQKQRHLFPHLAPRAVSKDPKKPPPRDGADAADPDDGIPDLGARADQATVSLREENVRLRAENDRLKAEIAELRERLGDDNDDDDEEASSGLSWHAEEDGRVWLASKGEMFYEVVRTKARRRAAWNVVVYENGYEDGAPGQRLNLNPLGNVDDAKAVAEADYAEREVQR